MATENTVDIYSAIWDADKRGTLSAIVSDIFSAETGRAEAQAAENRAVIALRSLLLQQVDDNGQVHYAWHESVRCETGDEYRRQRQGITDNAVDAMWSRQMKLQAETYGYKKPVAPNGEAERKRAERQKAEAELLAAYQDKSVAELKAERKEAYSDAGDGDKAAKKRAADLDKVLRIRTKDETAAEAARVAELWDTIREYGKRKADGKDNPLFVSDIRVLESVVDLLQSR